MSNFVSNNTQSDFDIIKQLFNIVIQYATNNKKFIKKASNESMQNGIVKNKNYFNLETICVIIYLMKDKKSSDSEVCFTIYEPIIKEIDLASTNKTNDIWNKFFDKII